MRRNDQNASKSQNEEEEYFRKEQRKKSVIAERKTGNCPQQEQRIKNN